MAFNEVLNKEATTAVANKGLGGLRKLIETKYQTLKVILGEEKKVKKFESNLVRLFNDQLKECDPVSVLGAAMQAAYLNLDLDPLLGQAYVIARKQKIANGQHKIVASFMMGYQGLIELARKSGQIQSINPIIVYDKEDFDLSYTINGVEFKHTPKSPKDRGKKIIGCYVIVKLRDGGSHFEWMWEDEILAIKEMSPAKDKQSSPWNSNQVSKEGMYKKTVIRRAAKVLPKSSDFAKAIALEEATEAGKNVDYSSVVDGGEVVIDAETVESVKVPEQQNNEVPNELF